MTTAAELNDLADKLVTGKALFSTRQEIARQLRDYASLVGRSIIDPARCVRIVLKYTNIMLAESSALELVGELLDAVPKQELWEISDADLECADFTFGRHICAYPEDRKTALKLAIGGFLHSKGVALT